MIGRLDLWVRRKVEARRGRCLLPEHIHAGDTYIVEFPKSGITWLTTLLANAFAIEYNLQERVTFASVRRFVPDLHVSRAVAPRLSPTGVAFYKSHSVFQRSYASTIYLVRHPLAVMKSYHRYRAMLDPTTPDFASFLDEQRFGLLAWRTHVRSWMMTTRDTAQRQLHLVRYEDLLTDAGAVLSNLSTNLGWGLSETAIIEAVGRSKRSRMQAQEEIYRQHNPSHKMSFVGAGEGSGPDDPVIKQAKAKIEKECAQELRQLGYVEI